jgi:hypothetical protein
MLRSHGFAVGQIPLVLRTTLLRNPGWGPNHQPTAFFALDQLVNRRVLQTFEVPAFGFQFDLGVNGQNLPGQIAQVHGAFHQRNRFAHARNVGALGLESFLVKLKVIRRAAAGGMRPDRRPFFRLAPGRGDVLRNDLQRRAVIGNAVHILLFGVRDWQRL